MEGMGWEVASVAELLRAVVDTFVVGMNGGRVAADGGAGEADDDPKRLKSSSVAETLCPLESKALLGSP